MLSEYASLHLLRACAAHYFERDNAQINSYEYVDLDMHEFISQLFLLSRLLYLSIEVVC